MVISRRRLLTGAGVALLAAPAIIRPAHAWTPRDFEFDPRSFGAAWDGVTNDTTAINAAFSAARTVGGTLQLPAGTGCFTAGALDFTRTLWPKTVKVIGAGAIGGSILKAIGTTGSWTHGVDITGSKAIQLENFVITNTVDVPIMTGLFAMSGDAGADLDMVSVKNLYISGWFTVAGLYASFHASSGYDGCKIYNYHYGPQPAVFLSRTNGWNLRSNLTNVDTNSANYGCSDIQFHGHNEWHDMSGHASGYAAYFDGCANITHSGNVSQFNAGVGKQAYILGVNNPTNVKAIGCSFYTDGGTAPYAVWQAPSGHTMTHVIADEVSSLQFLGPSPYNGAHT